METNDILKQMENVVKDVTKANLSDFYKFDKPQIENGDTKFPFIWLVGKYGTYKLDIGNYRDWFFDSEATRYQYLNEPNPWSYFTDGLDYKDYHWFLVTVEHGLQPINQEQAKSAIMDYVTPAVEEWKAENGPLPKLTKVPVKINGITFSELKVLIKECREHNDDSLLQCLRNFHRYGRIASDQYVSVWYNKSWNEFSFGHYVNGKANLNGGIIFHGWPETGYQTNNSVQLDPSYGWSSHT